MDYGTGFTYLIKINYDFNIQFNIRIKIYNIAPFAGCKYRGKFHTFV